MTDVKTYTDTIKTFIDTYTYLTIPVEGTSYYTNSNFLIFTEYDEKDIYRIKYNEISIRDYINNNDGTDEIRKNTKYVHIKELLSKEEGGNNFLSPYIWMQNDNTLRYKLKDTLEIDLKKEEPKP